MKQKKWIILFVLAVILAVILAARGWLMIGKQQKPVVIYGKELLNNGSFAQLNNKRLPENWQTEAYLQLPGISDFQVLKEDDRNIAAIINYAANDARFFQTVQVQPDTLYHLSGAIKAQAEGGLGANLSIADIYVFTEPLYDTEEEWVPVSLYGRTGKSQHEITVFARLGGYSGEAKGTASFCDLSLMAVEDAPSGFSVTNWDIPNQAFVSPETDKAGNPAAPVLLLLAFLMSGVMVFIARKAQTEEFDLTQNKDDAKWGFLLLMLFALLARLLIAVKVPGFPVDIVCFTVWAEQMADLGPKGFYLSGAFCDYPPGYMLVLWPLGHLGRLLGSGVTELMVKMPSILCDLAIVFVLFKVAKNRTNPRTALWLSALYAVNPLTLLAGAAWGQADSVPALLLILALLMIFHHKWRYALPIYVLAVLMKPQALMVGPLGLLALVMDCIWRKDQKPWIDALWGILGSFVLAAVIVVPFFNEQNGIPWLFDLYGGTMGYYGYATINATNLYFLFGNNWVGISASASFALRLTGFLAVLIPMGLFLYRMNKQSQGDNPKADHLTKLMLLLSGLPALSVLLPCSISTMGILMMVSVFLLVAAMLIQGKTLRHLPLLGAILLIGFSILGTMMHERYLFLAVALLTLSYVQQRDRRLLILLIMLSVLCFLNSGVVLDRGIRIGGGEGNLSAPAAGLVSDSAWLEYSLSVFSLVVLSFSFYLGLVFTNSSYSVQPLVFGRAADRQDDAEKVKQYLKPKKHIGFDKKDAFIILIVTLLYALLALTNLGSTVAPQTFWTSDYDGTDLILDLGEKRTFELRFYWGINWRDADLTISVSDDEENITNSYPGKVTYGDCFAWRTLMEQSVQVYGHRAPQVLSGRYVHITADVGGLMLMEVIAQDADTGENIPFVAASAGAEAVIDEPQSLSGLPTWYNSMYFDEIYHGRTAYEQRNALLGQEPSAIYETTHPPLGKVFMTLSVMVFGMTPFSWRLPGALAGVLMLPGMYLLGKQVTGKRRIALFAMLLMTFDLMHFAQTRIATIDSFVTLFIIYSYFFMFRFLALDYPRTSLRQKLVPLFWSGLMMGLGIASKWTGMYAGMGLAVLFFWKLIRNMLHLRKIKGMDLEDLQLTGEEHNLITTKSKGWLSDAFIICLWCLLFFVAIPAVIYYLSYIPVLIQTSGGLSLENVMRNNIHMFRYHSTLVTETPHSFSSPWWSWPLSMKPIYYYSGGVVDGTSSVIWSFGNPAVWWIGSLSAVVMMILLFMRQILGRSNRMNEVLDEVNVRRAAVLLISFMAQYLPWVFVTRETYIYHFFTSVPFIILCTVFLVDMISKRFPKTGKAIAIILSVSAFVLFVAFFPYVSGIRVSTKWLSLMQWFPNWLYF